MKQIGFMSIEGIGAILAGLALLIYIIKSKDHLKRFILRGYK
jgi:hypothetical protein